MGQSRSWSRWAASSQHDEHARRCLAQRRVRLIDLRANIDIITTGVAVLGEPEANLTRIPLLVALKGDTAALAAASVDLLNGLKEDVEDGYVPRPRHLYNPLLAVPRIKAALRIVVKARV